MKDFAVSMEFDINKHQLSLAEKETIENKEAKASASEEIALLKTDTNDTV